MFRESYNRNRNLCYNRIQSYLEDAEKSTVSHTPSSVHLSADYLPSCICQLDSQSLSINDQALRCTAIFWDTDVKQVCYLQ